ncbi:MAG: MFS transporter [Mycobacteriaceae bacterium]
MTSTGVTRAQAARRATFASVVGTTIEWYDFFLYGTAAALVFPHLFFPDFSPTAGVLASFSTQFVGFAARPVGAAIFGHYGDRIGRRTTLMVTLFLMAFGTVLIGVLPTYTAIGIAAPILLVVLRTIQGIGVGGEWGGSVLLSMEWGKKSGRGFSASWPQLGVPLGLVLSTGVVRITTGLTGSDGFDSYGWRIPFLLSIVLIGVGLFVRLRVVESPEFEAMRKSGRIAKNPLLEVIKRHPKEILLSALVRMSEQAPFYLFITFVLTYGTKHLGLDRNGLLNDTLIAAALGLISIPLFGRLSDRFGRRKVYGIGIALTAVFAFPYFAMLNTKSGVVVLVAIVLSLVLHDIQYGPRRR